MGIILNEEEFSGIDPLVRDIEEAENKARLLMRYMYGESSQTNSSRKRACQLACELKLLSDYIEVRVRHQLGPKITVHGEKRDESNAGKPAG